MIQRLVILAALLLGSAMPALAQHQTSLKWISVTGASGYNIYMAPGSCAGTFAKINATLVTVSAYVDTGQIDGEVRCYYVKSVASTGAESIPSGTYLATTPTITAGAPPGLPPPGNLGSNGIQ